MEKITDKAINALLVEDNPGDVRLIKEMLTKDGDGKFIFCNVDTLKRALAKLDKETFDIIILDSNLPDSKGFDTFERIYSQTQEIPIVVLTGLDDELLGERTIKEGAQDYFIKGHLDKHIFTRSLNYAISRKVLLDELEQRETRFRVLFDNISSGVVVYEVISEGRDFIIKDFNKAAEKIEGLKKKDVIGRSVFNVFPGVKEYGLFNVFQRVWKSGKPEDYPEKKYVDERIQSWRENYVYKLLTGEREI